MPPSPSLAVATRAFAQPLNLALRRVAACGATGVQFELREELRPELLSESGRRQFLHRLSELGLSLSPPYFPTRRALHDPEQIDDRVTAVANAMRFASELRARVMTLRLGPIPSSETAPEERRLLVTILNDLVRHGNHVGVTLAISPSGEPAAVYQQLLAEIKRGPIGIDFDPCSFVCSGLKVADAFRTLHTHIVHVQARDGVRDLDGTGAETAVGDGMVDWIELLALLLEAGYRGWVTAIRNQGQDRGGDVERAIAHLKSIHL